MKKLLSLVLVLALIFTLISCNNVSKSTISSDETGNIKDPVDDDAHGVSAEKNAEQNQTPEKAEDDKFLLKLDELREKEDSENSLYCSGYYYTFANTYPKDSCKLPDVSYRVKYFDDKEISEGFKEINYTVGSYKILSTYDEYLEYAYAPFGTGYNHDPFTGSESTVICIERKYDYAYGEEIAFRDLTLIDGKVCIVFDRYGTEITSSEPVTRIDFISLDKTLVENFGTEGEIIIVENRITLDEKAEFYHELAKKPDDGYYGELESAATSELNNELKNIVKKQEYVPLKYQRYVGYWQGELILGAYEIVSSTEELAKLAIDADKIDTSVFDDNVIICVKRREGSIWGTNIGFKNLTVRDGEVYIVLDRYGGGIASTLECSYANFLIIPKDKIPDTMLKEGNINVISNKFYDSDEEVVKPQYEELANSGELGGNVYYEMANGTKFIGKMRDVPIMLKPDRSLGAYKAFNTFEEYAADVEDVQDDIKSYFEDNVLIYIVGKYDPEAGSIKGFRDITWEIGGEACIVLDRYKYVDSRLDDKTEYYGFYIFVPRDEIPYIDGLSTTGSITILEHQIISDEEIAYYRELANKDSDYYEDFDGDTSGICNKLGKSIKGYFIPIRYSEEYEFWYGRLTVTDYKIISDYASLSEYTVKGEIDETVFENNVLLYVERCYPSINGGDLGFRNFEVKDGQLYIVVDRSESFLDALDVVDPHADFIVIPKDKLPEGVASEGRIRIVNDIHE